MSPEALLPFLLSHCDGCLSARQKGWRDGGMEALRAATWHRVELGFLPFLPVFFLFPSLFFPFFSVTLLQLNGAAVLVGIFAMLAKVARCSHLANIHPKLLGPIHMSSWGGTKREAMQMICRWLHRSHSGSCRKKQVCRRTKKGWETERSCLHGTYTAQVTRNMYWRSPRVGKSKTRKNGKRK